MRIAGAALALFLTAGAPAQDAVVSAPDSEIIQGRPGAGQRMTIPVSIGGMGPYDFIVDTGSQRSLIATSVAASLALKPARRLRIVDVGGIELVDTVEATELGVGSRSFSGMILPVLADHDLGGQGLIGTDNLQDQRVVIDFTKNRMTVGNARSFGSSGGYEIVVTARRKAGQLIITEATVDGVRTAVLIDTGAVTSVGNRALQRALNHRNPAERVTLISVTGNEVIADIGSPRQLQIGAVGITGLVVAYADSPVFPALGLDKRPALMLGMRELRMFRRVAIDFGSRKVMFDLPAGL